MKNDFELILIGGLVVLAAKTKRAQLLFLLGCNFFFRITIRYFPTKRLQHLIANESDNYCC